VYLVDTSIWVEVFRARDRLRLEDRFSSDEIATCAPVVQEVLQGFRDERAYGLAREALLGMPFVESPMELVVFEEAARLFRVARRSGLTIRSTVDCLVAACALRNGLTVLHRDRDFRSLARISALKEREP